jgi:C_GCAxxG_C_C family probable redox protein
MKSDHQIGQRARAHFDGGFNCAEAVLLAGTEFLGRGTDDVPRIATPFGGGLAGCGYTCGAISGGLMVIGLKYGRGEAADLESKRQAYKLADRLLEAFTRRFGSVNCRELSGVDFKTKAGVMNYRKHVHTAVCVPIVEFVGDWLGDNL